MSETEKQIDDGGPCQMASLRDYFASAAMQGELASQAADKEYGPDQVTSMAIFGYMVADAMITARKK